MGASVGIAAAHRRHVSFSDKTAVECDRQEAARASSARAVQHESARPSCDAPQSSCLRSDANDFHLAQLYSSSSGSLSDCSETTVRADSCSEAMDPSAFDIIYRSDATEPEALSCWSCGTVPSSLAADAPAFVLSYYREPAVAASVHWQRNTQGTGAAHSPHHHSAATLSSCLKQRPEGFKFQFADQAAAAASEAASRSLQGSIRAIEGRHALQRDAPVHSGRKRSRMISFS